MKELDENQCLEALYNGVSLTKIYAPAVRENYIEQAKKLGIIEWPEIPEFNEHWFMPEYYQNLDVIEYFSNKVTTDIEIKRVAEELDLFFESDNIDLLKYCIYLGDVIKENRIVTGVGRGSSVSVYLFYLAGLHKVDSNKYNLDYRDFFKIKGE